MKEKNKFITNETLRFHQESLLKHLLLLEELNSDLPNKKDSQSIMFSMLTWPMIESMQSLLILSEHGKLRDCFALARMVFELGLNIGYLSSKGDEAIQSAIKHAHQKSYRDLNRTLEIGDIKIFVGLTNIGKVKVSDQLKEAIDSFTTKKGKESNSWSTDSVYKKLEVITEKHGIGAGTAMAMASYSIYRHSSEILHGTIFGSMFALGLTQLRNEWPTNDKSKMDYISSEISLLLHVLTLHCNCVAKIILYHYPNEKLEKLRDELSHNLSPN